MSQLHGTAMPNPGQLRQRRKTRSTCHESNVGLVLMVAGLAYGLYLNFRFDPSYGALPVLLLVLGFLSIYPEVRRVSGRRGARR